MFLSKPCSLSTTDSTLFSSVVTSDPRACLVPGAGKHVAISSRRQSYKLCCSNISTDRKRSVLGIAIFNDLGEVDVAGIRCWFGTSFKGMLHQLKRLSHVAVMRLKIVIAQPARQLKPRLTPHSGKATASLFHRTVNAIFLYREETIALEP